MRGATSRDGTRWRRFFLWSGGAVILAAGISVWVTYRYVAALPPDCAACGMGSVGLVPLYLLTAVACLVLLAGVLVWLARRIRRRERERPDARPVSM